MKEKIESLYIHFPYCRNCCFYCDFFKRELTDRKQLKQFKETLLFQRAECEKLLEENSFTLSPLKTLYIGGGTPSLWCANEFITIFGDIDFAQNHEFTIEVNPGEIDAERLQEWREIGCNRISMGVQSLNDSTLKLLGRTHDAQEALVAMELFSREKINYSVDFLIGVSEKRDIISELKMALQYKPDHLSVYILTLKDEGFPVPAEEFVESEYLAVSNFLRNEGYDHYEVSNFALPGKLSRHNLTYWQSQSVLALGPSATGFLAPALRYKWKDRVMVLERLSRQESNLEALYMKIRTNIGVKLKDFGITPERTLVERWQRAGYIESFQNSTLILGAKGYLMLDSLMDDLFLFEKNL